MSYNTYQVAALAIAVEHNVAKKIYTNHFNDNYMAFALDALNLDNMSDTQVDDQLCGINAEESNHKGHKKNDHMVYEVVMLTDNPNPYHEVSTIFDENKKIKYYFGISLADSSYGDKVNAFINNVPQQAVDNYNDFVLPILAKYNVTGQPQVVIVQ